MKITLLTSLVGTDFAHQAGDTIDRPQPEAERLIAAGFAEPHKPAKPARPPAKPKQ